MKPLVQLIYASRASSDFHEHDIPGLVKQIRLANARRQLTGMLVYVGGLFLQVVEGEAGMLDAVYSAIQRDRRHTQVTRLSRESVPERSFEGWTMGYATIDPVDAGELAGQQDFFTVASCIDRIDTGRARTLLWSLNKRRWQLQAGSMQAIGRTG